MIKKEESLASAIDKEANEEGSNPSLIAVFSMGTTTEEISLP